MPPKISFESGKKTTSSTSAEEWTTVQAEQYFALCFWDWAVNSEGSLALNQQLRAAFGIVTMPQDSSVANVWAALLKFGRVSVEEMTAQLKARQLRDFFVRQVRLHAEPQTGRSPALAPAQHLLRVRNTTLDRIEFQNSCPLAPIEVPNMLALVGRYNAYKTRVLSKAMKFLELLSHLEGKPMQQLDCYEKAMTLIDSEAYPIIVPKIAETLLHDMFLSIARLERQQGFILSAADSLLRARLYCDDEDGRAKIDTLTAEIEPECDKKRKLQQEEMDKKKQQTSTTTSSSLVACVVVHPHESGMPERLEEMMIDTNTCDETAFAGRRARKLTLLHDATGREYFLVRVGGGVVSGPSLLATRCHIDLKSGLAPLYALMQDWGSVCIFRRGDGAHVRAAEVKALHEFLAHLTSLYPEKKAPADKEQLSRLFGGWLKTSGTAW